jgi:hypothetical protein
LLNTGSAAESRDAESAQGTEPQAVELRGPVAIESSSVIYLASETAGALWCCEILSKVVQRRQSLPSLREAEPELETIVHPFCIIVSQDCDLEQDFVLRQKDRLAVSALPNVLACEVSTSAELKGAVPAGKDIWKRIVQNKDERYQFLRAVPVAYDAAGEGLPELGIDFRRYFTVPCDELYEQFNLGAQRRCRLASPYKEHFMSRFGHFMARVGLPSEHFSG